MRSPGRTRRHKPFRASLERMEPRQLLATFGVNTTADSGPGSLRDAILSANARPGADNIVFAIPASTAPALDVPVAGFDPATQTWRIRLSSPLPPLADQVTIDGLTQANFQVPYRYPAQTSPEPALIVSTASTIAAKSGNNAAPRVIVDGTLTGGGTGFDIRASHSILRGMIIDGFGVGVSVPEPGAVGVLIQGNSIGRYHVYPVNPATGEPLEGAAAAYLDGVGNAAQGVLLAASNTTVGGALPQEANIIGGNGLQGISVLVGAVGNLIAGNQIGVAGPTTNGLFTIAPNGAEGVRIASSGADTSSSTTVDGNLISGNAGDGVHVVGPAAGPAPTRINITGNYIGAPPGGGARFGSPDTGNQGDGVRIDDAGANRIGGFQDRERNVIGANEGAGVRIGGGSAVGNLVLGNNIGVTVAGTGALGNSQEGVVLASSGNIVGPGNQISANLRGVLISGPGATGNVVQGNKIGTDLTGFFDLGNAREGVRIEGASGNQVLGNAAGSQVISGNNVGILIIGASSPGNLIQGNFIGTNVVGTSDLGNSLEGVRIEDSSGNTIGGTTASARNVISANHWGITLTGGFSLSNLVQGNFIGTDISGGLPLGNELDGVLATNAASVNTIGGPSAAEGNTIAFNLRDGVRVEDRAFRNAILTNRILLNGGLGINLIGGNLSQEGPDLTTVDVGNNVTTLSGSLSRAPNTTYLIQFFATVPDSNGVGEGDIFLGATLVTTDAAGNASFSTQVLVALTPGQQVTATATDPFGNTSEFSPARAEQPTTIGFSMAGYTVSEDATLATIVVNRSGGAGSAVSINFATSDGTARAGVDYQPASGTLTFAPGETVKTFTIPILLNPEREGVETVILNLAGPTGGAILGLPASAILSIVDDTTDRTGPTVISARAIGGRLGVASVIIAFDEPLDPARAVDLVNYGYSVRIAGRDGRLGTRDDLLIGVDSASLDPSGRVVTLLLARPVLKKTAMRLMINQATDVSGAGIGVSDVAGNLLDGDGDGRPGEPYVTKVVARPAPHRRRAAGRGGKGPGPAR